MKGETGNGHTRAPRPTLFRSDTLSGVNPLLTLLVSALSLVMALMAPQAAAETRGMRSGPAPEAITTTEDIYDKSHALVIGIKPMSVWENSRGRSTMP